MRRLYTCPCQKTVLEGMFCSFCGWYAGATPPIRRRKPNKKERKAELRKRKRIRRLRQMPYASYLQTRHWARMRRRALERAHFRCEGCPTRSRVLDVHHLTYARLGCELPDDLMVLCRPCHDFEHNWDVNQLDIISSAFRKSLAA